MKKQQKRRLGLSTMVVLVIAVLAVIGIGAVIVRAGNTSASQIAATDLYEVKRGSFDITVPTSGELNALNQEEIRNELEVDAVITEIVDEGTVVEKGTVLMRLNDEELLEELRDEQDDVNQARNDLATAEANLAIMKSEADSDLANADLEIQLAELALKAWEEGEDVAKKQELQLNLETAQKEFLRAEANFEAAESLVQKGFISIDEYRSREIAKISAASGLKTAELDIKVYEEFLYERDHAQLESALAQARDAKVRIELKTASELESATSELERAKYKLRNDEERLAKLQRQLDACVVEAPTSGLVVYASSLQSSSHGRGRQDPPQVGTDLRRNQLVMLLPNTSRMVAEVKVNEALSGKIRPGQRASVVSDALPDQTLEGQVLSVGVLAQTGGWTDPNRRDYAVEIEIFGENTWGLKPSMRCAADVYVGQVLDAIYIPVEAAYYAGSTTYVFVARGGGFQAQPIEVGDASDTFIEVLDGLQEGDKVLLRRPEANELIGTVPVDDTKRTTAQLDEVLRSPAPEIEFEDPAPRRPGGFSLPEGVTQEQIREWMQTYRETGELPADVPDEIRQMAERMGSAGGGGRGMRGGGDGGPGGDRRRGGGNGEGRSPDRDRGADDDR